MSADAAAPDIAAQYTEVCTQIAVLEEQRTKIDVRINAVTTDQEALEQSYVKQKESLASDRLKLRQDREATSRQIENLCKIRNSLGVERQVKDHIAAAKAERESAKAEHEAAKAERESAAAEWAAKNKEVDELIAKLKAKAEEPKDLEEAAEQ